MRGELSWDEWTMVDQLKPVDLSNIEDKGMQGIVLLAVALGWNLVQRRNAPAQLRSRQGITRNIPSDTGVRQSVFWSVLANVLAHSEGNLPTPDLMDRIVKQTGMSKAHAQVLRSKVGLLVSTNPKTLEIEEEPEEEEPATIEETVLDILAPEPEPIIQVIEDEFTPTERVEPTLSHKGDGDQYVSDVMETVIRKLVPDGVDQITYRCLKCGLEFPSKRGVGAHYQIHIKAGEAEPTTGKPKEIVNVIPDYEPTGKYTKQDDVVKELRRVRRILADVQRAVGQDAIEMYKEQANAWERKVDALTKERDDAIARADRLASDLRSLRELIGGISDA